MNGRLTEEEKQYLIDVFSEYYSVEDIYAMNRRIGLNPNKYYNSGLSMMELAGKFVTLIAQKQMEDELFQMIAVYRDEYYRNELQPFLPIDREDEIRLKKELNAIIIGINEYEMEDIQDLGCPRNDAEALAEFLSEKWDVSSGNIHLFVENTNYEYLMDAIESICESMTEDDNLLFYFSGHGMEIDGRSYLITTDSEYVPEKGFKNLISLDKLNLIIKNCAAKVKVRIFDACQCGENVDMMSRMTKGMLAALLGNEGNWVTFCSCNIDEVSLEVPGIGHGLFTYFLLKGLDGGAKYGRKKMYIEDLRQFVCENVPAASEQIGAARQNPQYQCRVQENIVIE